MAALVCIGWCFWDGVFYLMCFFFCVAFLDVSEVVCVCMYMVVWFCWWCPVGNARLVWIITCVLGGVALFVCLN